MSIRCLYLLDRNAVSIIKDSVRGKNPKDGRKVGFLDRLRELDRPDHCISPILSIIEGKQRGGHKAEKNLECQREESDALRRFFRVATIDSDYLDCSVDQIWDAYKEYRDDGWAARETFLSSAVFKVAKGVKEDKRRAIEDQIVDLAQRSGLAPGDPSVAILLGCLYGSADAGKMIKPSKFDSYNVLSDMSVLSRVSLIRAILRQQCAFISVEFVTDDSGLDGVLQQISILDWPMIEDGWLRVTLRYLPGLFPSLTDEGYWSLMNRIMPSET